MGSRLSGRRNCIIREEARRYKVITNGLKTEYGYFVRLNNLAIDNIEVETKKGLSLDEMLERAKNILVKSDGNYDEVCIVLDIDEQMGNKKERNNLNRFLENAEESKIPVYLSNESFEVWLLSHKIAVPKGVSKRKVATRLALKEGLLNDARRKDVVEEEITKKSILRALKEVSRLRRVYGDNILKSKPMTNVDLLVDKIKLK